MPVFLRAGRTIAVALALAAVGLSGGLARAAAGEDVATEFLGIELVASLRLPAGKALADQPVLIIVHDALATHRDEPVAGLSQRLPARGIATLAITLSLGLNRRAATQPCDLEHDHRHGDATDEISAWLAFLAARGAARADVAGFGRGGHQAALLAAAAAAGTVRTLVLIAPHNFDAPALEREYQSRFGAPLAPAVKAAEALADAGEPDRLVPVAGFLGCRGARVTAEAFLDHHAPGHQRPLTEIVANLKVPVLTVHAVGASAGAGAVVMAGADERFAGPDAERLADVVAGHLSDSARRR